MPISRSKRPQPGMGKGAQWHGQKHRPAPGWARAAGTGCCHPSPPHHHTPAPAVHCRVLVLILRHASLLRPLSKGWYCNIGGCGLILMAQHAQVSMLPSQVTANLCLLMLAALPQMQDQSFNLAQALTSVSPVEIHMLLEFTILPVTIT